MPRATPDYRAARAVLAAPYPLPVVFTRQTRPEALPDQETIPGDHDASGNGGLALLARNDTAHGFPAYNTHWRELPPAIPPIPYPPKDAEAPQGDPKKRRIKLTKHGRKPSGTNGECELMSGIEEEPSRELRNAREIGAWSLEVGRQTAASGSGLPNQPAGNVLTSTYQARLPLHLLAGRPHHAPGPQVATFLIPPAWAAPAVVGPHPGSAGNIGQSGSQAQPLPPYRWPNSPPFRRSKVAAVRPSADIDSDDTLASDSDVSLTASPQQVTPASNATSRRGSRQIRHSAKNTPTKSKPLFLGQTGLSPFTYMPPARHRTGDHESSADEAGFETEATVKGTITRIARSRHLRGKHKQSAVAPTLLPHRPSRPPRKDKKRSVEPAKGDALAPLSVPSAVGTPSVPTRRPAAVSYAGDPPLTPPRETTTKIERQICPLPSRKQVTPTQTPRSSVSQLLTSGPTDTSLRLRLESLQDSPRTPTLQRTSPFLLPVSAPAALTQTSQREFQPFQPPQPWNSNSGSLDASPVHMSNGASPPFATTVPQLRSPFVPLPLSRAGPSGTVPPQTNAGHSPQAIVGGVAYSCLSDAASGSSVSAARRPELPIAKLCHNFLLAKKLQEAKKRKLGKKHVAEMAEREKATLENALSWQTKAIQIEGPPAEAAPGASGSTSVVPEINMSAPPGASDSLPAAVPSQASGTPCRSFTPFRAIESLARVDEARPPRKRRRAARSSSSEDDSPATSIPMPTMFGGPVGGPASGAGTVFRSTAVTRQRAWKAGKARRDL